MLNLKIFKNLLLVILSSIISIYTFELYLAYQNIKNEENKRKIFIDDWKGILENEKDIIHYMPPKNFITQEKKFEEINKNKILPLASKSNQNLLLCNEKFWLKIKSDRYGFNNNDDLWDKKIDFVVIGDSQAMGFCVERKDNFTSLFSKKTNYIGLNLGQAGHGPILTLATLLEYGLIKKPKFIVHIVSYNDFHDINSEIKNNFLVSNYVKKNNLQKLILKQKEIDVLEEEVYKKFFTVKNIVMIRDKYFKNNVKSFKNKVWKLGNIRKFLNLTKKDTYPLNTKDTFAIQKKIIETIQNENIKYFTILYENHPITTMSENFKEEWKSFMKINNIKTIIANEFFDSINMNIKKYFRGHLNEYGNELLVNEFIKKNLN